MPWPTPQDYNEAVQHPATNFADAELRAGTPELTPLGLPRAITGGFASVYRLRSGGCDWAVRCFLREVPDQQARYAAIGRHLAAARLPHTVPFAFLAGGIRVGGRPYPVLKMAWVAGEPLDRWIERHLSDPAALRALADRWLATVRALRAAGVAHGDLQHGNILVVGDEPRLIDYDGMFVPALAGRRGVEVGHRNYQHPRRDEADFGPGCDAFAAWTIFLSIRALAVEPALWSRLGAGDEALLLRREDYERPATSAAIGAIAALPDPALAALVARFRAALAGPVAAFPPLDGTDPALSPARRAAPQRRGRPGPVAASRPPVPATGAAAWLTDHLVPAAPLAVTASYTAERLMVGLLAGSLLGLLVAAFAGLLAFDLAARACGLGAAIVLTVLAARYLASPLLPRRLAAQARVWRTELQLHRLGARGRGFERRLARIDAREAQRLDALGARRGAVAREAREAVAAIDRALGRFAIERQLLGRAEEEELAGALRDLRQGLAADHLAAHPVLTAAIPGLGPQLKLRLLAAGVRTAAQIRDVRVTSAPAPGGGPGGEIVQIEVPGRGFVRVDGLGRKKATALLAWRQLLEAGAAVALPEELPAAEEAAIRLRFHNRRQALDRREAAATRAADRRKETLRARARDRRAALDRRAAALRDDAHDARARLEAQLAEGQAGVAAAHLARALARRDLAAYDGVRFARYLRRIVFPGTEG